MTPEAFIAEKQVLLPARYGLPIEVISSAYALEAVKMVRRDMNRLKHLADAICWEAQYLTTDASRLQKAMEEYHQFIIHLNK